jgi:hypothetical protein
VDDEAEVRLHSQGAVAVLAKPFRFDTLADTLRAAQGGRSVSRGCLFPEGARR